MKKAYINSVKAFGWLYSVICFAIAGVSVPFAFNNGWQSYVWIVALVSSLVATISIFIWKFGPFIPLIIRPAGKVNKEDAIEGALSDALFFVPVSFLSAIAGIIILIAS